ncbi:MAG: RIP metalloprotease RseP [Balneola sp.]
MEIVDILKTIGIFMGALMILVFIHELGHFLAAKLFGMRVERFSVGFPPRIWGFQKGDTDYCIGATPLGGYVKISGMVDESMDTEFLEKEPEPWEYRSKPVWQRMIVITAGVIFNMILAFFIFTGMTISNGKLTLPLENVSGLYIPEGSFLEELGFQTDDKIIGVNGEAVSAFEDLVAPSKITSSNLTYQVIRDGQEIDINVPSSFLDSLQTRDFINPAFALPSMISSVSVGTPADEVGLKAGDRIIQIDSIEVKYWIQLTSIITSAEGKEMDFTIQREDSIFQVSIAPDPESNQVGVGLPTLDMAGGEHVSMGLFASIGEGWNQTWEQTAGIIGGFSRMISGDISVRQNLGGPIAIASITRQATDQSGWTGFWQITALLSITLAIMNILPIPALDGGHLVFLIYEGIVRKEPSEKVKIVAQNIGFIVLLTLMVFVIFNDVLKYF